MVDSMGLFLQYNAEYMDPAPPATVPAQGLAGQSSQSGAYASQTRSVPSVSGAESTFGGGAAGGVGGQGVGKPAPFQGKPGGVGVPTGVPLGQAPSQGAMQGKKRRKSKAAGMGPSLT